MSTVRAVAWGVLVLIAWPSVVRADSLASNSWTFFFDAPAAPVSAADASINFGAGSFPEASILTTGTAAPWYQSPAVSHVYGHTPTPAEQTAFTSEVLSDVKATFAAAGLDPNITIDPTVPAHHTLSVVSGLSYASNSNAIGITDVGHDGFGFIDKLNYATSPDQLAWAVAHNVSHELMHAFGVGTHPDSTGQYIDAATTTWTLLTDPNATFSPDAARLIGATNFGPLGAATSQDKLSGLQQIDGAQEVMPVPEPSTLAAWSIVVVGLVYRRRQTTTRSAA